MKAERIAELRSAWPRGGGMWECLDEIERLQTIMHEVAAEPLCASCNEARIDAAELAAIYVPTTPLPLSPANRAVAEEMAREILAEPEPERCNATWKYPDDGCIPEHRGELYRCGYAAGHAGQHLEPCRATWSDASRGAKPHMQAKEKAEEFRDPRCVAHLRYQCRECKAVQVANLENGPIPACVECEEQCSNCSGEWTKLWREAEKTRTERDELRQQRDDEAYHHAACLSIAEGVPGWESFEAKYEAAKAVKKIRKERDEYVAAAEAAQDEVMRLIKERDELQRRYDHSLERYIDVEKERDEARGLAVKRGEIQVRLQDEVEKLRTELAASYQTATSDMLAMFAKHKEMKTQDERQIEQLRDALKELAQMSGQDRAGCRYAPGCRSCEMHDARIAHLLEVCGVVP